MIKAKKRAQKRAQQRKPALTLREKLRLRLNQMRALRRKKEKQTF